MKYCIPYSSHFKYRDKVDEMIFLYDEEHNQSIAHTLLEKHESFSGQRVIIKVLNFEYYTQWKMNDAFADLKKICPDLNLAILFLGYRSEMDSTLDFLKSKEIPFFFETRVTNWDTFHGLLSLGVSDIYIVENLGFELRVHVSNL